MVLKCVDCNTGQFSLLFFFHEIPYCVEMSTEVAYLIVELPDDLFVEESFFVLELLLDVAARCCC